MRRRKTRRRFKSRSILYISAIVALNFMGLGYAMWEDSLSMSYSLTTGSVNPSFIEKSTVSGYGEVETSLSEDSKKLFIEGTYYPSSNIDISISVENDGTIPVVLDNNRKLFRAMSFNTGISDLQELSEEDFIVSIQSDRESTPLYTYETQERENDTQLFTTTSFDNNIEEYEEYQNSSYLADILAYQVDIQSLESSIKETQKRISKLEALVYEAKSLEEQHSFNHTINYIQIH